MHHARHHSCRTRAQTVHFGGIFARRPESGKWCVFATPSTTSRLDPIRDSSPQILWVPVFANTSFKIRGEPFVCAPEGTYRCWEV